MIKYAIIEFEPNEYCTMVTLQVNPDIEIVHCVERQEATVFTSEDEFELYWKGDIVELATHFKSSDLLEVPQIVEQLSMCS